MLCKMTEGADVSDIANISVTVVGGGLDRPAIEYRAFGLLLRYGQDRTLQLSTNFSFTFVGASSARPQERVPRLPYNPFYSR